VKSHFSTSTKLSTCWIPGPWQL